MKWLVSALMMLMVLPVYAEQQSVSDLPNEFLGTWVHFSQGCKGEERKFMTERVTETGIDGHERICKFLNVAPIVEGGVVVNMHCYDEAASFTTEQFWRILDAEGKKYSLRGGVISDEVMSEEGESDRDHPYHASIMEKCD